MIFLLLILSQNVENIASVKAKVECGYKQCPPTREGALNVHIIPHSHMDAGWVKTFDEYYYGTKSAVSTANVQLIYHSVLSELLHDNRRKFTFSETAYFWRWWKEQRPTSRATFRSLVQEGRIQFAGGGWVQNDEATVDYVQIIDQFTWGLRKLNDTLGPCGTPKAAWQIDTYGHTREQASLLAQMGYDGLFLGRVDHKERETMMEEDRMEFMWRGSDVLGKMSDIMSHTLFNLYNAPDGFCFDFLCSDEPIVEDPDSRVYNADKRVNDFISQIEKQAKYYDHDNILVTMGGDFTYQSAANWFMNIDKIINYVSTHSTNMSDINVFYSTPSCYLKAIYLFGKRDKALHTEKGDHLPYGSDLSTYWTGFYTSRPALKYFVRRAHIFLQVVKQLTVISRMADSYELHLLRHATSLILHHDAITGTSQQHVTNDFIKTLSDAVEACTKKVSQALSTLTPSWGGSRRPKNNQQFVVCHQLNISQCRFMETQESILLLVYNPLSTKTYHHVRLPVIALHFSIRDYNDEEVEYQLVSLPAPIINMPGRASAAIQELYFEAENIPPLGYTAYYITSVRDPLEENAYAKKSSQPGNDPEQELIPYISNEYLKVTVDKSTGLLESVQHIDGAKVLVSQNFYFYGQGQQTLQSGAYAFRPGTERPTPVSERAMYYTIRGSLVKEIRQRFNDWVTQIIRLYRGEEFVELEWLVGPVPVGSDLGKEVVSIFKTNISNNGEFYTDSNSRQMMKRTCWNQTSNSHQKKPVPACYYPVTSRICIRSSNTSAEMCVLTDRAQGGTSYDEGELELMMHRRLLTDDGFGLEESLNEDAFGVGLVVKGKHRMFFGNYKQEVDDQTFSERTSLVARKWTMEPWLFLTSGEKINRRKWQNVRNKRYSALRLHGLPRHVHVLTLEPWKAGSVLLRLENTLEKARAPLRTERDTADDYHIKTAHITVDLRKVFLQMKIKRVRETTLAANQWLEDARQMDWSTRYVYNGADDDILPEDLDYAESIKTINTDENKESDTVHYSDEESEVIRRKVTRRRNIEKGMSKIKAPTRYDSYDGRRKRSLNITENLIINDNSSNKILIVVTEDKIPVKDITTKETIFKVTTENIINATDANNNNWKDYSFNEVSINFSTIPSRDNTTLNILKSNMVKPTGPPKTKNYLSEKIKMARFLADFKSEELVESDEDGVFKNRRRFPLREKGRSSNNRGIEIGPELDDEGITKSIYEMYYKVRPRKSAFKPHLRSSYETTEQPRRTNKKRTNRRFKKNQESDSCERTLSVRRNRNRRRRVQNVDMPFFITDRRDDRRQYIEGRVSKRRVRDRDGETYFTKKGPSPVKSRKEPTYVSQEYDTGSNEGEEMETDDRDIGDYTERRKKRATNRENDSQDQSAERGSEDYIITLRPTQIRTFVVWFEDKKSYTL